jgi:hydrogenase-1 operon protein HyaF
MKQGFWVAPEGAEQPINVFPIGDESLALQHSSLTGAGTIKALASLDGAALAEQCPRAMALLEQITGALATQRAGAPSKVFRLDDFTAMERKLVSDVFGEGEVSGVVALPDGTTAQIQESVLAGLWQIRLDGGIGDAPKEYVEVAAIPELVLRAASDLTDPDFVIGAPPPDAMNVMPVLSEIRARAQAYQPGSTGVARLRHLPRACHRHPQCLVGAVFQCDGHHHPRHPGSRRRADGRDRGRRGF